MKIKGILHEAAQRRRIKANGDIWYELDNAANLFPAVSNDRNTNVFRISCDLRENIDKAVLQQALDKSLRAFPYFRVAMHRGLFWFYLEQTDISPQVSMESRRPCARIFYKSVKDLLFQVSYFGNRINIEAFHAIADGSGVLELLRTILVHYLSAVHGDKLPASAPPLDKSAPPAHMAEDSFKYHYDPTDKQSPFTTKAYGISGTLLPGNSVQVIGVRVSTKQLLSLAKSKGVTITAYLAALMICSIYKGLVPKRASHKTIAINVPVDLRGHFSSETARNFFSVVDVGYNFQGGKSDFDAVLTSVAGQLSQRVKPDVLAKRINYTMSVQDNVATSLIPLALKNAILRAAYNKAESATTCALSNMGKVTMPEHLAPYIDSFHCLLNPTLQHRLKATVTSFGDVLIVNLTSCIAETRAQRIFVRHLADQGIDVSITCNGGAEDEAL